MGSGKVSLIRAVLNKDYKEKKEVNALGKEVQAWGPEVQRL